MAQSVELVVDDEADDAVRREWDRLADAGLPSSRRDRPSPHHCPHLTLYAATALDPAAEPQLRRALAGLELELRLGPVMVFGPRRGRCVLVRSVLPTVELVTLQRAVADACEAAPEGQFAPGRWAPHVTLSPRLPIDQLGSALTLLGDLPVLAARSRRCRRWDGDAKTAWWLTDESVPD